MFKALKRRATGKKRELFEFKFKFQATRVPAVGWDRLVVCLVPLGSGKSSSKTQKAVVQNGVCHWGQTVVERVKLYRDKRTGVLEEKIYRIVVSTGSSRAGVLGETHLNLADCISNQPEQRSLVLKHCPGNTILHTSISCTFSKSANDTDGESASALEDHDVFSEEDPLSDSERHGGRGANPGTRANGAPFHPPTLQVQDALDSPTSGGVSPLGLHSRVLSGESNFSAEAFYTGAGGGPSVVVDDLASGPSEPWTVNAPAATAAERMRGVARVSWKDKPTPPTPPGGAAAPLRTSQEWSSQGYASMNPVTAGRTVSGPQYSSPSMYSGPQLDRSPSQSRSIGSQGVAFYRTYSSPGLARSGGGISFSPGKPMEGMSATEQELLSELEKAEIRIESLQTEAETWKRSAMKYSVEMEEMQVHLQELGRAGQEVQYDQEALIRERGELREEVARLKAAQAEMEMREDGQAAAAWEAEAARRALDDLRAQNKEQAEQIENFKVQLGKIQESNMILMEAVKESEDALAEKVAELEEARAALRGFQRQHSRRNSAEGLPRVDSNPSNAEMAAKLLAMEAERESLLEKLRLAQQGLALQKGSRGAAAAERHASPGKRKHEMADGESVDSLKKLVKELEEEAEELTEESLKLAAELAHAHAELEEKNQTIAAMRERGLSQPRALTRRASGGDLSEVERLQAEVMMLERKLAGALEEAQEHSSRARDMASEADTVIQLRREVAELTAKLSESKYEVEGLQRRTEADARALGELNEAAAAAKVAAAEAMESRKRAEKETQALQAELASVFRAREDLKAQFAAEAAAASSRSEQRIAALQAEVAALSGQVASSRGTQAELTLHASESWQAARETRVDAQSRSEQAEAAAARAEQRCRTLESEMAMLMMQIGGHVQVKGEVEEARAELEAAVARAQSERDRASARLLELEQSMAAEEAARREAEASTKKLQKRLAAMEEETAKRVKALNDQVGSLMEAAASRAKLEGSGDEPTDSGSAEVADQATEKATGGENLARLEAQLAAERESQSQLESKYAELLATKAQLEAQVATLTTRVKEHAASLEEASKKSSETAEEELALLKGKLAEAESQKEDLQVQLEAGTSQREELTARVSQLENEVASLRGALEAVTKAKEELAGRLESGLKEQVGEVEELRAKVAEVERLRQEAQERAEGIEEEKRKVKGKLQLLEGQVVALTGQIQEHVASKREVESRAFELHAAKAALTKQLEKAQEEVKETGEKLGELEAELTEAKGAVTAEAKQRQETEAQLSREARELSAAKGDLEGKLVAAEEALKRADEEKASAVARLQGELEQITAQLTTGLGQKELAASEALVQASELRSQKAELEETLKKVQEECTQLGTAKTELESQVLQLRDESEARRLRESQLTIRCQELEAEVEETKRRELAAATSSSKHKSEVEELRVSLAEAVAASSAVRGAKDALEARLLVLEERATNAELEAQQREQERSSLSDKVASLSALLESVRGEKKEQQELAQELERKRALAEAQLVTTQGQLQTLQEGKAAVEEKLGAAEKAAAQVASLQSQLEQKSKACEALQIETTQLQAAYSGAKEEATRAQASALAAEKAGAEKVEACRAEEKLRWEALVAAATSKSQAEVAEARKLAAESVAAADADAEDVRAANLELRKSVLQHEAEVAKLKAQLDQFEQQREQEKTVVSADDVAVPSVASKAGFFSRGPLSPSKDGREVSELRRKVTILENELQHKVEALMVLEKKLKELPGGRSSEVAEMNLKGIKATTSPPASPPHKEARQLDDLKHKVKLLEGELKRCVAALEKQKRESKDREKGLLLEVERLQNANLALARGGNNMGIEQLRLELVRLQNANADFARKERELNLRLAAQEALDVEVTRLQEANDELAHKMRLYQTSDDKVTMVEKVHQLEMELAEALEANAMYREQLKSTLSQSDNVAKAAMVGLGVTDMDQMVEELRTLRANAKKYDDEMRDLRDRYTQMSLRFAEVEAEREQLVQEKRGGTVTKKA